MEIQSRIHFLPNVDPRKIEPHRAFEKCTCILQQQVCRIDNERKYNKLDR